MFDSLNCQIQQLSMSQDSGAFHGLKAYLKTRLEYSSPSRLEYLKLSRGFFDERSDNITDVAVEATNMVARSRVINLRGRLHCPLTTCDKLISVNLSNI